VSFASATVLQRELGWKVGIPAYAVASFIGASRIEDKRHFLSDVAFGAAIGIARGARSRSGAARTSLRSRRWRPWRRRRPVRLGRPALTPARELFNSPIREFANS
jgi:membrane-associated phospholipid phosphatase